MNQMKKDNDEDMMDIDDENEASNLGLMFEQLIMSMNVPKEDAFKSLLQKLYDASCAPAAESTPFIL